jgi:hypothetical protein
MTRVADKNFILRATAKEGLVEEELEKAIFYVIFRKYS